MAISEIRQKRSLSINVVLGALDFNLIALAPRDHPNKVYPLKPSAKHDMDLLNLYFTSSPAEPPEVHLGTPTHE